MSEIKEAMKNKETDKKDVLKMAVTKAQSVAKEKKCEITEEIMLDGIKKELKQLNQTKDSLKGKEDSDLYKSTLYKIEILNKYLPEMLGEKDVMLRVIFILEEANAKNKGEAMKIVMKELKGKADNKTILKCVDEYLKL
jgi:uncharacterized protein YqeY